ncbi:hypothetical protein Ancab_000459 [Ancistrocladus abbreviatus]
MCIHVMLYHGLYLYSNIDLHDVAPEKLVVMIKVFYACGTEILCSIARKISSIISAIDHGEYLETGFGHAMRCTDQFQAELFDPALLNAPNSVGQAFVKNYVYADPY